MRAARLLASMLFACCVSQPVAALESKAGGTFVPAIVPRALSAADPSAPLFDPGKVVKIDIQVDAEDWNRLCAQRRTFVSLFRGACLAQPFPSPFTWFRGRVTIDGQVRENVGIRKKGFLGSLDSVKPSLKISLTQFQDNTPLYGLKKLTLNNAKQDPSFIRQCLGYGLFARAGLPAPRCNFADVKVNGASLGIYVNVEDVRKPMLARYFDDTSGNLYEGTVSDFHPLLVKTFEAQTNEAANDRSDIAAVIAALAAGEAELMNTLGSVVDLDAFVRYWAMEALVGQWDGYTSNRNNYYAYHDPTSGKFHFIPWGADTILADGYPIASLDPAANKGMFAYSAITRRLVDVPEMRARYLTAMQALLDSAWNEAVIQAEIDRMQALLEPYVGDLSAAMRGVREFVAAQRGRVTAALGSDPTFPPLTILDLCLVPNGSISGGFVARWGTTGSAPPFQSGAAILQGKIGGVDLRSVAGGADAGLSVAHPNPYEGFLNLYVQLDNGARSALNATLDPTQVAPGATLPIDGQHVDAIFLPLDGRTPVGLLDNGTIKLRYASHQADGKVCGSFEADSYVFSLAPLTGANAVAGAVTSRGASAQPGSSLGELMRDCQPAGSPR